MSASRSLAWPTGRTKNAAGCLLALALAGGCRSEAPLPVFQDLLATASVADRQAPWDTIWFGTAAAEQHQEHGFLAAEDAGVRFAWVRRRPDVVMKWAQVAPRLALLDAALPPGLEAQVASLRLNGAELANLTLGPARQRYRIALPEALQRVGQNRLSFAFEQVTAPSDPAAPRLAAAFYGLSVGEPQGPLADLLARGAPAPWELAPAAATLQQAGPSSLSFALTLPPQAELRFTPGLHPMARAAGGSARLAVSVQTATSPEREIWSGTPGAAADEVRVALPAELAQVSLRVEGSRYAWGSWRAPRIVAPAAAPPARATPDAALRAALRDVNVVFIILDAAGAAHFGCYGSKRDTTPEIDRLAREGVLFLRAFTPAVFTLSAMASVWTSQYHDQHHEGAAYDAGLPRDRLTLAELLSAQGIHTSSMVANGIAGRAFGLERGFAEYHQVPAPFDADGLVALVPAFLEKSRNRRFFAYLHFREPHFPYDPGPPWDTRFGPDAPLGHAERTQMHWIDGVNARTIPASAEQRAHLGRLYDANLARADHAVGQVRHALEAAGMWDRTVVIVTADHGEALGEHGFFGHNEQLYDESVHIPLVLRIPSGPAGVRIGALVDLLAIAPTVADIFGVSGAGGAARAFQGESLLGLLGGAAPHGSVLSRSAGEQPKYAWRDARYKLIYGTRYGQQELYDLASDPGEQREIGAAQPLLAALYRQQLQARIQSLRRGAAAAPEATALSPEQRDNLKALGYIQ